MNQETQNLEQKVQWKLSQETEEQELWKLQFLVEEGGQKLSRKRWGKEALEEGQYLDVGRDKTVELVGGEGVGKVPELGVGEGGEDKKKFERPQEHWEVEPPEAKFVGFGMDFGQVASRWSAVGNIQGLCI